MSGFKPATLAEIAKQLAGANAEFKNFHGKLYSFIPPSQDKVIGFLNQLKFSRESFPNKHPCAILIGDLSGIISHQSTLIPATNDGKLLIQYRIDSGNLPKCTYLALISPFASADGNSSYALAFESINFTRTYLSLFFGTLTFYTHVADFDFNIDGQVSLSSPIFRMPLFSDFFKIFDASLSTELLGRLKLQLPDFRARLQRACNFFANAMNQRDEGFRFASYWIALEVLVGSTDDAIRQKLADAYGYKNKSEVDDKLYFSSISTARHDLIHNGLFSRFYTFQERLLQLYFWDLVIAQVNLPHQALARVLVTSGVIEQELRNGASAS